MYNELSWIHGRPVGRYIDLVLPLVIILGLFSFNYYRKLDNIYTYLTGSVLALSSFLVVFPLFPINNLSVTFFGLLKFIFDFVMTGKFYFAGNFSVISIIFFSIFFFFLVVLIRVFTKRLNFKMLIKILLIYFMMVNLLNFGVTYWNVERFWEKNEQVQLGVWLDDYDTGDSVVLFDGDDCSAKLSKQNNEGICLLKKNKRIITLAGLLMNKDIIIGSVYDDLSNVDYIISKKELGLKKIKEINNIKVYESK
jgi:hypothetical protein